MSYEPPIAGITTNPTETQKSMPVRVAPQRNFRTTFAKVRSSFDTTYWTTVATGSGQTATQAGGNGLITSGTTANAETIIRSTEAFTGSFTARVKTILSQRIANQNFFVELVDVIGDARAITIASATACTVTFPTGHGFTSENVGQFMSLGAYSGTGTFVPGRYAIASVSGDNITFTVAGFAAGSGTCSVFGWNYHRLGYQGTTATSVDYDTQRDGWASGQTVATTINTTASPGHLAIFGTENNVAFLADQLVTTSAVIQITTRGQRVEATPANDKSLYLQIRCANGSTAPASTTTWTIGTASVEDYVPQQVSVTSARTQSPNSALPVEIVRAVTPGTTAVTMATNTPVGNVAHDAVDSGAPIKMGGKAYTANPVAVASADRTDFIADKLGKQVVVGSIRDLKGNQKTTITSSVAETTIVTAVAATFLDLYSLLITNTSATACNVTIKDATAGTTRLIFAVPAAQTVGFTLPESAAHKQAVVNNNWTATCSASVASIEITALFVQNL